MAREPVRGGIIDNNNLIGRARTQQKRFQAARRDVLSIRVQEDDAELAEWDVHTAGFYAASEGISMTLGAHAHRRYEDLFTAREITDQVRTLSLSLRL